MKKTVVLSMFLLLTISLNSQIPQAINYQAVIRDTNGIIISNKSVSLRISILSGNVNGALVYSEVHNLSTNQFGIVNILIGKGSVENGDFSNINWSSSNHFVRTELDATGGSSYILMGIAQLLTVPYSFNSSSLVLSAPGGGKFEVVVDDNGKLYTICSPQPTPADAGEDAINIPADSIQLHANTPVIGATLYTHFLQGKILS